MVILTYCWQKHPCLLGATAPAAVMRPQSSLASHARACNCSQAIGYLLHAQVTLRNGLRVFLVEDHDVPLVKASLLFRGGMRNSPPDKVGPP